MAPFWLIKNTSYNQLQDLYKTCPTDEQLKVFLGRARAKRGMFEGDLEDGELEIGQIAGVIHSVETVQTIFDTLLTELETAKKHATTLLF